MSLRQKRLEMLRKIVFSSKVGNQEELLSMLADNGIVVTQATLSRDLKELQVAKTPDAAGEYRYRLPEDMPSVLETPGVSYRAHESSHIISGIRSIEFSGQAGVLKTRPGYANMVASVIDNALSHKIMGTIAGDDTILIVLRAETEADEILAEIERIIPGISARRI